MEGLITFKRKHRIAEKVMPNKTQFFFMGCGGKQGNSLDMILNLGLNKNLMPLFIDLWGNVGQKIMDLNTQRILDNYPTH